MKRFLHKKDLISQTTQDADLISHGSQDTDLIPQEIQDADLNPQGIRDADLNPQEIRDADLIPQEIRDADLIPQEIRDAELWKLVQRDSFQEEITQLSQNKSIPRKSKILSSSPTLDANGIIRLKGRTMNSPEMTVDSINPIILDPRHHVTKLLISYFHQKYHHQGQETVLNELRQKYWILNARSAVRRSFHDCRRCQLARPIPLAQEMGFLPAARVTRQIRPFVEVGMDYFGPIEVTVGRRHEKRYGALFTCMTTRAVHIEVAASLATDSAIMAIRRMIARRGNPTRIFSDNGTNFHGSNRELKEAFSQIDQNQISNKMTTLGIEWNYIPPYSPHMGGAWERLVRSIKTALALTLKQRCPKDEVLHILLLEAEHIVNSRPLTYVSSDHKDPEALTPNHFLLGSSDGVKVPGKFTKTDLCLRKQWRETQALADVFWKRWISEYLPTLNKRTKWISPGPKFKIGDLVFLADGSFVRGTWPKGVVTATFPRKDGQVRVVDVKTESGTYRRPITKILIPDA